MILVQDIDNKIYKADILKMFIFKIYELLLQIYYVLNFLFKSTTFLLQI